MAFTTWLRRQVKRDDPVGDLARDFKADPAARNIRTLTGLTEHLLECDASEAALRALTRAGAEWSKSDAQASRP